MEKDWAVVVAGLGASVGCSDVMIAAAVDRLEHGDVCATKFGTRVALRPDLDDDRSALSEAIQRTVRAYWPDDQRCRCWMAKKEKRCSHTLAAAAHAAAGPWALVDVGEDEVESVPAKARNRVSGLERREGEERARQATQQAERAAAAVAEEARRVEAEMARKRVEREEEARKEWARMTGGKPRPDTDEEGQRTWAAYEARERRKVKVPGTYVAPASRHPKWGWASTWMMARLEGRCSSRGTAGARTGQRAA